MSDDRCHIIYTSWYFRYICQTNVAYQLLYSTLSIVLLILPYVHYWSFVFPFAEKASKNLPIRNFYRKQRNKNWWVLFTRVSVKKYQRDDDVDDEHGGVEENDADDNGTEAAKVWRKRSEEEFPFIRLNTVTTNANVVSFRNTIYITFIFSVFLVVFFCKST